MTENASLKGIKYKPGLQIWTINDMKMVPVPKEEFGNFFEGDCYVVLYGGPENVRTMNIHYWIGNNSSQDEQGAAAVYVTQLDDFLGGSPVQNREVQGFESAKFKSYFKNGIIYKKGGVGSGFKHVETNVYDILRLLHVKGRKDVTAMEVDVSWASFNNGDIFLLDMGKNIVQWNGPESNRQERLKGCLLAQSIRDRERGGRAQIGIIEGEKEEAYPELMKIMISVLGQRTRPVKEAIPDSTVDQLKTANVKLYQISDDSGKLIVQEVASSPLTQNLLNSNDCYIADIGGVSLAVWKGKKASDQERRSALQHAVGFIKAKNYPPTTPVEVMSDGAESAMFKQLFKSWTDKGQTQGLGKSYTRGQIAKVDQVKFNVMELHAEPKLAAQERMVDDASGEVKIWRIEHLELQEVPPSTYGQFYGGDCYLILYTYNRANKPQYLLYMWLGRHATQDEITACAYQAVNIDNKYNGAPVQVRVTMGKEPRHFLAIFKGKLIIYEGGTGKPGVVNPDPGARLFQVKGTDEMNTKATEVPARASSLNSNDVFFLKTKDISYMWYGKGCSGDEREMGKTVADVLSKVDKQIVMEGQEPAQFWVALGGKAPYSSDKSFEKLTPSHTPRLFECSNQTGQFRMEEVANFSQDDLDEDDVMLLDTWEEIFLWIGNSANQFEIQESNSCALEYLKTHPAGRSPDTPIISVKQGYEPPTFTGWFNAWDTYKWSGGLSYEEMKSKVSASGSVSQTSVNMNNKVINRKSVGGDVLNSAPGGPNTEISTQNSKSQNPRPLVSSGGSRVDVAPGKSQSSVNLGPEKQTNNSSREPQAVDPSNRENYLSDADFESLLGCSRSDFQRLPKWRQSDLKKKAGLL
ncbi:villin-1 [Tachysurus fulvidraco]|uniref:villin-1 n=1 Tax=Tachysurus fulvidraco TaxID=1234273 RepID=UPI001FEEBF22|nr:villin-1 [Tachysurus fulvidraco]XP_047664899.1 villin-1 [Tachysurus fulvidraco]XP_047664900.1 villin-1 [Tachysurus fulvidraco]